MADGSNVVGISLIIVSRRLIVGGDWEEMWFWSSFHSKPSLAWKCSTKLKDGYEL